MKKVDQRIAINVKIFKVDPYAVLLVCQKSQLFYFVFALKIWSKNFAIAKTKEGPQFSSGINLKFSKKI